MKRALLIILCIAALASVGLAQDGITLSLETRLSIVESRLARLEMDVGRLSEVPVSLARIEQQLTALTERATGNSGVLQTVGLGIVMTVISSVVAYQMGKRGK